MLFSEVPCDQNMNALTKTIEKLMIAPSSETGMLVDKLVRLEPEILGGSLMDLQVRFIFSSFLKLGKLVFFFFLLFSVYYSR